MAASVSNTKRAIEVSQFIVRAFIKMREMLFTQEKFSHRLNEFQRWLMAHDEILQSHDKTIKELVIEFNKLAQLPEPKKQLYSGENMGFGRKGKK